MQIINDLRQRGAEKSKGVKSRSERETTLPKGKSDEEDRFFNTAASRSLIICMVG
jgi:hypothetical protein